jgi:hypothetical protein
MQLGARARGGNSPLPEMGVSVLYWDSNRNKWKEVIQ